MWTIRPAEHADHDEVLAVWMSADLGTVALDEWESLVSGATSAVLIAEDGGETVGAIVATFDGWRAYIYHAAVKPSARHRGIGHALMSEAERHLTAAGARHVYVMVNEQNAEGLALAGSNGYLPEGDMVLAKRLAVRVA